MFYDSFLQYFESMSSQFKVLYQYQFMKNGVAAHYVDAGCICQKCDCYKIGTSLLERITDMSALNKNAAHRLKRSI